MSRLCTGTGAVGLKPLGVKEMHFKALLVHSPPRHSQFSEVSESIILANSPECPALMGVRPHEEEVSDWGLRDISGLCPSSGTLQGSRVPGTTSRRNLSPGLGCSSGRLTRIYYKVNLDTEAHRAGIS